MSAPSAEPPESPSAGAEPRPASADAWLSAFAQAVRDRDLAAGEALFGPDAVGYGTRTPIARGLPALLRDQWAPVWAATSGFAFDVPDLAAPTADGGAVIALRWASQGRDGTQRPGRATVVLRPRADGSLVCTHSHFSLDPDDGGRV
jgi:ketosteroid isomerase-like protein